MGRKKDHPSLIHYEEAALSLGAVGINLGAAYKYILRQTESKPYITLVDTMVNLPDWVMEANPTIQLLNWAVQEFNAISNWFKHGQIVYRVDPLLTQMLQQTEIRIPFEMFQLPFPSFYVEFGDIGIKIRNSDGTADSYLGTYVWNAQLEEKHEFRRGEVGDNAIFMYHVSRHKAETRRYLRDEEGRSVPIPSPSNTIRSWYRYADLERLGFSSHAFETILREDLEVFRIEKDAVEEWAAVERLIAAFIVYLTMPDIVVDRRDPRAGVARTMRSVGAVKNKGKKRKLLKQLGRMSSQPYLYLPYAHAEEKSIPTSGKWKLSKRVPVTGHFKAQSHGKNRALRKTIWIKPYWKGPEGADLSSTPRKVR